MKKAIYFDYGNGQPDLIIRALRENEIFNTVVWIDNSIQFERKLVENNRKTFLIPDYDWFDLREGVIRNYCYTGAAKDIYDKVFDSLYEFQSKICREDIKESYNAVYDNHKYTNSSFYASIDIFNILIDFFANMVISKEIEVVFFNNFPHEGADYVLYKVAKALNIQTIIFAPSIIPGKFYYMYDLEDFGDFKGTKSLYEIKPYKINNSFEKDLFYMKDLKPYEYPFENLPNFIKPYFTQLDQNKLNNNKFTLNLALDNIFRYLNFEKYKKNIDNMTVKDADLSQKFVYFPLHFQPECTTSAIGGIYNDQLLALERISDLIPDDWFIYIKEHLIQREFQRDESFFRRLKGLKKVKLLPMQTNTNMLTKESQFVSTITGTVGWEAISGGKNVLIFGNAWYKTLPGVFSYSKDLKTENILNYKINHNELEEKMGILYSKMGNGVVDSDFRDIAINYEHNQNIQSIVEVIKRMMDKSLKSQIINTEIELVL